MDQTTNPYIPGTKILDDYHRDAEPAAGDIGYAIAELRGVDEGARTAEFVISSGEIDRYGEIVDPKAFDKQTIDAFMRNPVALASHQHSGFNGECTVVGTWQSIRRAGDETLGVVKFDTDEIGEQYWGKVRRRVLRACSIGFIVRAWEMREVGNGENKRSVRVFTKIELIEVSIVAVPANRQALLKAAGFNSAAGSDQERSGADDIKQLIQQALSPEPDSDLCLLIQSVVEHALRSQGNRGHGKTAGDEDAQQILEAAQRVLSRK